MMRLGNYNLYDQTGHPISDPMNQFKFKQQIV